MKSPINRAVSLAERIAMNWVLNCYALISLWNFKHVAACLDLSFCQGK